MNKRIYQYALYACLATVTVACSTQKELVLPERITVPVVSGNPGDTISPGNFKQVFNDPYLRALIDTALHHNYDLLSAAQQVKTAEARLMMAKKAWMPSLDLSLSAGIDKYAD